MRKILKFVLLSLGIGILVLIKLFFPIYHVASHSMEPTINKGDYIVVSRYHYNIFELMRNDIVLFEPVDEIFALGVWTHRIIATEEDIVLIKDNFVYVNENSVLFPNINHKDLNIKVQKDFVFQKGDNKNTIIGVISKEKIIGKVIFNF